MTNVTDDSFGLDILLKWLPSVMKLNYHLGTLVTTLAANFSPQQFFEFEKNHVRPLDDRKNVRRIVSSGDPVPECCP